MHNKTKSYLKKLSFGMLSTSMAMGAWAQSNSQPNIILIFTDDQGYGDLGCYGSTDISTPTIDSLAGKGIRFTNFYVSQAVSSASRTSLLTGCYSNRVGITGALMPNSETGIASEETTLAEVLKAQGYATAIFGKWHLGDQEKFLPLQHGFDEYTGLPYSNDMWPVTYDNKPSVSKSKYPELHLIEGNEKTQAFRSIEDQDSLTRLLTQKAVDFIHRKADQPFFLYFPHPMPHVPLGVSEKFAGTSDYGRYGDVIQEIDWSVKQLVKALEKEGISNNTLIIFTSDNGPWKNFGNHAGTTGGLREGKGCSWEGGHRVPCIMAWPDNIPEGLTIHNMASTLDILPTLAEITNAKLPERKIDGVSILPLLKGDTTQHPRTELAYYYNDNDLEALRQGNWKIVFPHTYRSYLGVEPGKNGLPGKYNFGESGLELYNLKDDPFETKNLILEYPEVAKQLQLRAEDYRNDLGDFLTGREGTGRRNAGFTHEINTTYPHKGVGAKVELLSEYHLKYSGRGPHAIMDGTIARSAFKDRAWQGYQGNDLEAIVRFDSLVSIDSITISTLQNEGSWIFLPKAFTILYSEDGVNYVAYGRLEGEEAYHKGPGNKRSGVIHKSVKAKSLKIIGTNIGTCPKGHDAEGEKAWMFIDEIIIE